MPHKLLLADDSVTIQRVIELTFADEDVHVIAVGDGKQAIERLQQDRPDIVLADIGMPERDGYEVASFIKSNPQLAHIPVLLLTGAFEPIDETRAQSVGCDGVLVKPFEPQMVINRVRDLLAGRKPAGLWATNPSAQPAGRSPATPAGGFDSHPPPDPAGASKAGAESLEDYFDRLDAAFGSKSEPPAAAPQPARVAETAPVASQNEYGYRDVAPPQVAAPPPASSDVLADWDPELTGDPARPQADTPSRITVSVTAWNPDLAPATRNAPAPPPQAPLPVAAPAAAVAAPRAAAAPPAAVRVAPPATMASAPPAAVPAAPLAAVPPMPALADAFAALLAAEQGQPVVPSTHRATGISGEQVDDIVRRVIDRMGDDSMRRAVLDVAERLVREEIARIKGR